MTTPLVGDRRRSRLPAAGIAILLLVLTAPIAGAGGSPAVGLGTADSFAVLGGTTVTNTGPTVVSGDLGVSPGNAVVGFPPGIVNNGTIHAGDAVAAQAQADLTTAYNDAAGRACDVTLTGQDLGGLTLTTGVYCFATSAQLTGALTLDAQGDPNAVFIFQIGSTLTTASASSVNMINGGQACNVFWQVGSSATLGTTTDFIGTIMALTSITANNAATVNGRLLARNGAVTMDTNTIVRSDCDVAPPPTASITIVKDAQPDGPQDFAFTGDLGPFVLDDDAPSATPRQLTFGVDPGTYTVTESDLPPGADPHLLESIQCTGGTTTVDLANRQVVIEAADGDVVRCTFVNVAEDAPPPPPPGEASITIVKDAVPDDALDFTFSGDLGAFVLDDDPSSATPRQLTFLEVPGSYTVIEGPSTFDLTSIQCTGGTTTVDLALRQVTIVVADGDIVRCVFVNTSPTPPPPGDAAITIVKDAQPDSPQNFTFSGTLGGFVLDDDPASGTPRQRRFIVDPGTYTITEDDLPPGAEPFDLESIECTGGTVVVNLALRQVVIEIEEGEQIVCTFVNVAGIAPPPPPPGRGSITIVKDAQPNSAQDFVFTGLGGFVLDDDPSSGTPRQRTFVLVPGTYVVTEQELGAGAEPFDLESIICTGGTTTVDLVLRRVTIVVAEGDTVRCVFVNRAPAPPPPGRASITIVKDAQPDSHRDFPFTGTLGNFVLDDSPVSDTPRQRLFIVEPGTYVITEAQVAPFALTSIRCTGGEVVVNLALRQVVITVADGDQVRCVFVNVSTAGPPSDGDGDGDGDGLPDTGLAVGGLLALSLAMLSTGGGLVLSTSRGPAYAGLHRARRRHPGRHRPGTAAPSS